MQTMGRVNCTSPFDSRPDSNEIWERVRKALNEKPVDDEICSPKTTAKMVSQFAVLYCASVLPYHYQRRDCLSLLDNYRNASKKYRGNPEELFYELLAVYRGEFPQGIEENYCTGIYIPASNVPRFLLLEKSDLKHFRGLRLILEYAEQNRLAYWEATDLPLERQKIWDSINP